MSNSDTWLDWFEFEDEFGNDEVKKKIKRKQKTHNKKEWDKINEKLHKNNKKKYIKNKRRKSHNSDNS